MRRSEIAGTINITAPAVHAGAYTTKNNFTDDLYVWYLDGDTTKAAPHVTVGKKDESKQDPPRWVRLHVTVPILNDKSVANVHFFYKFHTPSKVEYVKNNADDLYGAAKAFAETNGTPGAATRMVYDQLAQAFVTAAHPAP